MNEKHTLFRLIVQEQGVSACIAEPGQAATFLLVIGEAISNGFWADASEAA